MRLAVAVGRRGAVMTSVDRGATWVDRSDPANSRSLNAVHLVDAEYGCAPPKRVVSFMLAPR